MNVEELQRLEKEKSETVQKMYDENMINQQQKDVVNRQFSEIDEANGYDTDKAAEAKQKYMEQLQDTTVSDNAETREAKLNDFLNKHNKDLNKQQQTMDEKVADAAQRSGSKEETELNPNEKAFVDKNLRETAITENERSGINDALINAQMKGCNQKTATDLVNSYGNTAMYFDKDIAHDTRAKLEQNVRDELKKEEPDWERVAKENREVEREAHRQDSRETNEKLKKQQEQQGAKKEEKSPMADERKSQVMKTAQTPKPMEQSQSNILNSSRNISAGKSTMGGTIMDQAGNMAGNTLSAVDSPEELFKDAAQGGAKVLMELLKQKYEKSKQFKAENAKEDIIREEEEVPFSSDKEFSVEELSQDRSNMEKSLLNLEKECTNTGKSAVLSVGGMEIAMSPETDANGAKFTNIKFNGKDVSHKELMQKIDEVQNSLGQTKETAKDIAKNVKDSVKGYAKEAGNMSLGTMKSMDKAVDSPDEMLKGTSKNIGTTAAKAAKKIIMKPGKKNLYKGVEKAVQKAMKKMVKKIVKTTVKAAKKAAKLAIKAACRTNPYSAAAEKAIDTATKGVQIATKAGTAGLGRD